jgi:IS5 family transposase
MPKGKRRVKEVLADNAYASCKNSAYLKKRGIRDLRLRRGYHNQPLSEADVRYNTKISQRCFAAEPQFGTKMGKFDFSRASYFADIKVQSQSYLKAMRCNL